MKLIDTGLCRGYENECETVVRVLSRRQGNFPHEYRHLFQKGRPGEDQRLESSIFMGEKIE